MTIAGFLDAEAYLLGTINESISRRTSYKLDRMRALLHELGDPQTAYPTIHIGGTSGKGSTSTMIASVLSASGKRTGLHTKPHLKSMTERVRIDGLPIDPERFADRLAEMMPAIERVSAQYGRPTYYETLLALSFVDFARERVDVAAIEVGLGGRLDGTNVIEPVVGAITTVGLDHTDVLGETIEEIASEKAGIAKPGVPLVLGVRDPVALDVIERHAAQVQTPVVRVEDAVRVENASTERFAQRFDLVTDRERYELRVPVLGAFQRTNAATAVAVLERLPDALRPDREAVERGLASLTIPGRMEVFPGHPVVVFDIAHNAEKAASLAAALGEHFPGRRVHYVVAIGQSKDAAEIVRALATLPSTFTFTSFTASGREATRPQRLALIAEGIGQWGRAIGEATDAFSIARRNAGGSDLVVVTGSTFVVAELRQWWIDQIAEPSRS
jgi:dihydrofolate synthase/folylpolyglutamate synthase